MGALGISLKFSSTRMVRFPKALQISMVWPSVVFAHRGVVCASRVKAIAPKAMRQKIFCTFLRLIFIFLALVILIMYNLCIR